MAEQASVFGGRGRPKPEESTRRRKQFVRLVLAGQPVAKACEEARIQPLRALHVLDELAAVGLVEIDEQALRVA